MDSRNEVSPEAMQARIQQARREAETLKDKIKRKKDELADTTRMSPPCRIDECH
jgi:guanine nucleotide-binding protein G(I)/G(S)/G(T) subunit beta-1